MDGGSWSLRRRRAHPSWRSLLVLRNDAPMKLGVAIAVVVVAACSRPPDFKAYCEKAAPCEDKSVEGCIKTTRHLWHEQKKRGCASEGTEIVECKIKHGSCESANGWSLFMPTDACRKELDALTDCLAKDR